MTQKLILLAAATFVGASSLFADGQTVSGEVKIVRETTLKYLLYRPELADGESKAPLLLFLHGAGERGDDLELVKTHGPPKLIEAGREFPFFVLSPQCPAERWWDVEELLTLLDDVIASHAIDTDRIYVTGLSMGGYGTWALAQVASERFAAVAPVCGGGIPYLMGKHPELPVWAFHGTDDSVVPLACSEMMIDMLKRRGGDPKFTAYEDVRHDSWTATYDNDELYRWLLSHRLSARE